MQPSRLGPCLGNARILWVPGHGEIAENKRCRCNGQEVSSFYKKQFYSASPRLAPFFCSIFSFNNTQDDINRHKTVAVPTRSRVALTILALTSRAISTIYSEFPPGPPPELALPRSHLAHLLTTCFGHGNFATYHERFKHGNATL